MHELTGTLTASGLATVERGTGLLSRMVAAVMGFPRAGTAVPVRVDFRREGGREVWRRHFAGKAFAARRRMDEAGSSGCCASASGRSRSDWRWCSTSDKLRLVVRRWSAFGVPLPLALAPRGEAFESADDGRFNFHVEIGLPLVGLIVRYRGWLVPQAG